MTDTPVRLVDAGKRYTKYEDAPMLVTSALRFRSRTRRTQLWAVRHVDLDVPHGECVGVIGRNGSGKSTMLQLLAGVTAPTEGVVAMSGRVAPLISVGVGFHPELTGRENVFVNGMVLGLSRSYLEQRFDEIVEFSEIGAFIDTPVKFYSSGMLVRLGFSVAIHSDPEILLVDEVLAVGDLAFQFKCFDRMAAIREAGATIVVVSHNLNAVRRMCNRTMVLHDGLVRFTGDTNEAISIFHDLLGEERDPEDAGVSQGGKKVRRGVAEVESLELLGPDGEPTGHVESGGEVVFRLTVRFDEAVEDPVFGFAVTSEGGTPVYSEGNLQDRFGRFQAGERAVCDIKVGLSLTTGSYSAGASVADRDLAELASSKPRLFYVSGRRMVKGVADLHGTFTVTSQPNDAAASEPPDEGVREASTG